MAKTKKNVKKSLPENKSFLGKFNLEEILPQKHHIWVVILIIIILFLIFLNPLFFGNKTFQSGDIISSEAMKPYVENHTGGYTLWNPLIFCGMPAYAIGVGFKWFNLIYVVFTSIRSVFASLFSVGYAMWTFYLILLGITSFLLMKYLTKNTMVSLFTALATSFSTGIIVFLYIGHVTKLTSLCMFPLIFLMLLRLKDKIRLLDFLILIITLQIFVMGFHAQIIFYTLFAVAIYFIYYFFRSLAIKDSQLRTGILKSAGVFIAAVVIALLIQLDSITQIYEYTPYSTRGTESILDKVKGKQEENSSGYYKYHTDWSFSPGEVLTFVVPSYYGFGNSTYDGPLTRNQPVEVNTYFGQMPFVDVAMYMGVVIFFLGLFAVFTRWKDPFIRFLTILAGISLLISFGKNFPIIFDLFFNYLPYFNKFRVPSMILVLDQVSFPILAGLGLMRIISLREEKNVKLNNIIRNIAFVFTGIFILSLLLSGAVSGWFAGRVNDYATSIAASNQRLSQQFQALSGYTASMFSTDLILAFLFLSITTWAAYLYINNKFSKDVFVIVVIVISVIDLWRIDARGEHYVDNPSNENLFAEPDYIKVIKEQKDKNPFRILNIKQDRSIGSINNNENFNAHFLIEDFYGYSAIKPRAFQDMMDVVGPVNETEWRMFNVKYIVMGQQASPSQFPNFSLVANTGQSYVYKNNNALPRAYFVNQVEKESGIEFLRAIKDNSFDPKQVAYLENQQLKVDPIDSTVYANVTNYSDENIGLDVKASGNNFLFLGDTYVKGWKAYIDGSITKVYEANHGYMGIVVPKGEHKVEFKYAPVSFYISKNIALVLSSLVLLGLVFTLFFELRKSGRAVVS